MGAHHNDRRQRAATVLLLEDEYEPALLVEAILSKEGYDVVGPVPNIEQALALLRISPVDVAIVDLRIDGKISFEVGRRCDELGIPWGITTAYFASAVAPAFSHVPALSKPFADHELLGMVSRLLQS